MNNPTTLIMINVLAFGAVFLFIAYGWRAVVRVLAEQERRLDQVLNKQLLMDVPARVAMLVAGVIILAVGIMVFLVLDSPFFGVLAAGGALFLPHMIISHLEEQRRRKLDEQVVDGVTTLASGVRAGLTLVQAMQLLRTNTVGPIKQEFTQLLHEYDLGIDLHEAMRNTANRIGSQYYRLLFSAIEAHRKRGGDLGQSLDRIAESIREIQRLEGRLDAMTAQGRAQARFMVAMPFVIIAILYTISPDDTNKLITEPLGRFLMLIALGLIFLAWLWIRRIMQVDI